MLFGIKIALLHFYQMMKLMLGGLVDVYILVYLDNILIYLIISENNKRHIKAVFE